MEHPRLGRLTLVEDDGPYGEGEARRWEAAVPLPSFASRGVGLRRDDDPPPGLVRLRVEDLDGTGVKHQQDAAIAHLLDCELEVFAAVWGELAPQFRSFDLETEVICTEVEVSGLHIDGVAYLGFSIDCDGHLEHGFQVVYHSTRGTFWGDWEALNAIEEADNL